MAKYNFHVVLPDGTEYLTETIEEARAIEARYGKSKHLPFRKPAPATPAFTRPDRSKLVRNASQAPPSRKDRMKPVLTDGYKHPPQAWAREAIQNSFDAGASRLEFVCGDNDTLAIDDGLGMSEEVLLNKLMVPGMSEKPSWAVGGFGEAKKLLTFPWDHFIIVTKTMGGETLVINGSGEIWDYWKGGKCYAVKYARQRGAVPPHFIDITQTKPDSDFLPYADVKPIIAKIEKQGRGTALYIRGTEELHEYMAESYTTRDLGGNKGLPSAPDVISYVVKCDLPGKTVVVNGEEFLPNFAIPSNAKKFPEKQSYSGITLHLAPPASADNVSAILIRAKTSRGTQLMWTEAGIVAGVLFVDITGDTKRLLNNVRSSFLYSAEEWWQEFKKRLAKDVSSTFREEAVDIEFEGSGEGFAAEREEEREQALEIASRLRDRYEERASQRPSDSKAEQRKKEQEEAEEIWNNIRKVAGSRPTRREDAPKTPTELAQEAPEEIVKDMVKDALAQESAAAVEGVIKLALWRPPLRLTNEIMDWPVPPEWFPETMGDRQIRLLRAWTEALRKIHAILSVFDSKFAVGFVFSEGTLAFAGWSKTIPYARSYCLNPFVFARELRAEELMIPRSLINLRPDSPDVIELDARNDRHLTIIAARAVHECVHGIYGIGGHDEHFSSGLTCMIAQIGDKMPSILAAAKKAAAQPVPRIARGKGGEEVTLLRAPPRRVQVEEGGVDPRLPPPNSLLVKGGDLVVLVRRTVTKNGVEPRFYVLESSRIPQLSVFNSLSAVAKAQERGSSINGYAYFDLKEYPRKAGSCLAGRATPYYADEIVSLVGQHTTGVGRDFELSRYDRSKIEMLLETIDPIPTWVDAQAQWQGQEF